MPDIDQIKNLIELAFGRQASTIIIQLLVFGLLIWLGLQLIGASRSIWLNLAQPLLQSAEEKHRARLRRIFATYIVSEIDRLNRLESWSDYRFADLEAEVEASGHWKAGWLRSLLTSTYHGTRREPSLSRALERSTERLILVEGDPGSGKSVALRYVAKQIAQQTTRSRNSKHVIPIYINLRNLEREVAQPIDRNLIERFILRSLTRVNDRDIEAFLDQEFSRGLIAGTWLFLFDSFDEIPEILSATDSEDIIGKYSEAIFDFLHGMNCCRGIIASRHFRRPEQSDFCRFLILPLTQKRKLQLIRKASLPPQIEHEIIGSLGAARWEMQDMAKNPMFLGLLCQHVGSGNTFPENGYVVFESYINSRIDRDKDRLKKRFNLTPQELRLTAESVAFAMSADDSIGLNPTREALTKAIIRQDLPLLHNFNTILDALEYTKIARTDGIEPGELSPSFAFAHRRFQEYFATSVVLRESSRVSERQLLLNPRWRETAVVLFQTQEISSVQTLVNEAHAILAEISRSITQKIESPIEYISDKKVANRHAPIPFIWSPFLLHVLSLLQDGFSSRLNELPDSIRLEVGRLILSTFEYGILLDKKWSLEVAGTVPQPILLWLIRRALANSSSLLQDIVYHQVARLRKIPSDIAYWIRISLLSMNIVGGLYRDRFTTRTHLSRLDQPAAFLSVMNLVIFMPFIDNILYIFYTITILSYPIRKINFINLFQIPESITKYIPEIISYEFTIIFITLITLLFSFIMRYMYLEAQMQEVGMVITFAFIRCIILLIPLLFFDIQLPLLYTISICIYVSTWYLLAQFAATYGVLTKPILWPFFHVLLPLYLIFNIKSTCRSIITYFSESEALIMSVILTPIMGILFGIYTLLEWFSKDLGNITVGIIFTIMIPTSLIFAMILVHKEIIYSLKQVYLNTKDFFLRRRWVNSPKEKINGVELLTIFRLFSRGKQIDLVMQYIRINRLIVNSPETEQILLQIITAVETLRKTQPLHRLRRENRQVWIDNNDIKSLVPYFTTLEIDMVNHDLLWLLDLNSRFLNEATLLLEQVRKSKYQFEDAPTMIDLKTTT